MKIIGLNGWFNLVCVESAERKARTRMSECREVLAREEAKEREEKEREKKGACELCGLVGIAKADRPLIGVGEDDWSPPSVRRDRGDVSGDVTHAWPLVGFAINDKPRYSSSPTTSSMYSSSLTTTGGSRLRRRRLDSIFEKEKNCVIFPELINFRVLFKKI